MSALTMASFSSRSSADDMSKRSRFKESRPRGGTRPLARPKHEDAGCIELVGGTPGVIPKSNRGVDWALLRGAGSAFVVGTGDLLRVARDKLCRVRIDRKSTRLNSSH